SSMIFVSTPRDASSPRRSFSSTRTRESSTPTRGLLLNESAPRADALNADHGAASCEGYSPQSSSASGASARASGVVSFTSSSAPQSGHDTISPFTASDPTVTSASHSGHFGTASPLVAALEGKA